MKKQFFTYIFLLFSFILFAQNLGDFRTRANDRNWNATNCWQTWNGTTWVNITTPPPSGTQTINILHRLRININLSIDNVTFLVQVGGRIRVNGNRTLNLNDNAIIRFAGTNANPLFKQNASSSIINFNDGSSCVVANALTAFTIPPANTWHPNSVISIETTAGGAITFTNSNQDFGIFEYNRTAQTAAQTFNFGNILNRISVVSTGTSTLSPTNTALNITGDIYIEGGFFNANGTTGAVNQSINDLVVNSGTFRIHNNVAANSVVTVRGNLTFNGGAFAFCGQASDASSYLDVRGNVNLNSNNFENLCSSTDSGIYFTGSDFSNFTSTVALASGMNERFYFQQTSGLQGINLFFNGTAQQSTFTGNGNLDPLGAYIPIELSPTIVKDVTINNNSGVLVSIPFQINDNLFLTDGTLNNSTNDVILSANATVHRTGGSVSAIFGGTDTYDIVYPSYSEVINMGNEIPDSNTRLQNLTISNTNGVKAGKSFQVNGILNLNAANPNTTDGLLDMVINYGDYATRVYGEADYNNSTSIYNNLNSYELSMGAAATTAGEGDVTGKIRRNHTFTSGVPYSFGNPNTRMTFTSVSGSALPTQMLVTATRGPKGVHVDNQVHAGHPNELETARNTVQRMFQFQKTGGASNTLFVLRMPYTDAELNGNAETDLVTWDHHLPYSGRTPHEHGQTSRSAAENWVELANHGLGYLATEGDVAFTKYWMLSTRESESLFEFIGAVPLVAGTNWGINSNWTGGVAPTSTDRKVIIRPNAITPNPLVINGDVAVGTFEIMTGGEVTVTNGATITVTDGPIVSDGTSSWNNEGTFNTGTGKVLFTGTNAAISGNANFYDLEIASGGVLTNGSGSVLSISNTATNNGTWNTTTNANTVVYNGTAQNITQATYHSLQLDGSGNHSLPSQTNLNGDLTVNNADMNLTGKTLNFVGTLDQTINGTNQPNSYETLVVNKSAGTLLIDENIAVNTLTLTNGLFSINQDNTVRLTNQVTRTSGNIGGLGTLVFEGPNSIPSGLFASDSATNNITLNKVTTNFSVPNNFTILGNLALEQGTMVINTDERINLAGGIVKNQGFLNVKNATLGFQGSGSQNIGSGVFVDNEVKIIEKIDNGSVSFLGNTIITELLSPNGGVINSNGNLTFRSTASETAFVGPVGIGASVNGNVIVERYFPAKRAWRFFSSPVNTTSSIRDNWMEGVNNTVVVNNDNNTPVNNLNPNPGYGIHITGLEGSTNGFDQSLTNSPSLYAYEQFLLEDGITESEAWLPIENVSSTTISAGKGYRVLVRGDRTIPLLNNAVATPTTIRTTGVLVTGNQSLPNLSTLENGYSFLGNPYQAPINMLQTLATASANIDNSYFVWDPLLGDRGAYVTIQLDFLNNLSDTSNNTSAANEFFQPGQAVFLKTNTAGAASISVQENHKAVGQNINNLFRQNNIQNSTGISRLRVQLYDTNALSTGGTAKDGVLIKFSSNYNYEFVQGEDANKFSNIDEDLAIQINDEKLSIGGFPFPSDGDFIQLHNTKYRVNNYTYKLFYDGVSGIDAFLLDQHTQTLTQLNSGEATFYSFQVDSDVEASTNEQRFKIVFNNEVLSNSDLESNQTFSLYPNPAVDAFYIRTLTNSSAKIKATNMLGQVVFENEIEPIAQLIQLNAEKWQAGTYLIHVSQQEKTQTFKLVVKP